MSKYNEYQLSAKRINQRMLEFEKRGRLDTEYTEIQQFLKEIGVQKKGNAYRMPVRNPEKMGKESYNALKKKAKEYNKKLSLRASKTKTKKKKKDGGKKKSEKKKSLQPLTEEKREKLKEQVRNKIKRIDKYGLQDEAQRRDFERVKEQMGMIEEGKRIPGGIRSLASAASKIKVYKSEFQKQAEEANKRLRETRKQGFDYISAYKNNIKELEKLGFGKGIIPHTPEQIAKLPEEMKEQLDIIAYNILSDELLTKKGRDENYLVEIQDRMRKYNSRGFEYKDKVISDIAEMIYSSRYDWTKLNRYLDSDQIIELTQEASDNGALDSRGVILDLINEWEEKNGKDAPSKKRSSYAKFINYSDNVVSFIRKNMDRTIEKQYNKYEN